MGITSIAKKILTIIFVTGFLVACGGDGKDTTATNDDTEAPTATKSTQIKSTSDGSIIISGHAEANSTIFVTFPDGSQKTKKADADGNYAIKSDKPQAVGDIIVTSTDADGNTSEPEVVASEAIIKSLYKVTGEMPKLAFMPSVGINTEAPQGEADIVGQAMPFVDIFKTARPFAELSKNTLFDSDGWPTTLDPTKLYARTKLLQGTVAGAIPNGKYTLLYEGNGTLQLGGGAISNVKGFADGGHKGYTFDFILKDSESAEANVLNLVIRDIHAGNGNYIKNIKIIMPGGSCINNAGKANPFIRLNSQSDCPADTNFVSYVDQIKDKSRNDVSSIIFNPDYLLFLRNFKVVRMMNLMEASHGSVSCPATAGVRDENCIKEPMIWDNRAKLSDAVWGGSARTPHSKRNGVPIEVVVLLANTLKRDMWVNIPHSADNNYINQFAYYVSQHLDTSLKTYIEYSNETWNPGFLGHHYVELKGIEEGLNTVPAAFNGYRDKEYFARLRFYSARAVQIFQIWKQEFNNNTDRLVRVLGTNQGDKVLSEQMIKYVEDRFGSYENEIDAIAMAPYFFGCSQKTGSCEDAPKALKDAVTTDDVFDIIDQPYKVGNNIIDPSALDATIAKIKAQAAITSQYNLQLLTYEGGQHLTTSVMGRLNLNEEEKARFRLLFKKVNRDPRIKARYETLLNAWKETDSASLFTLYTLPQTYYRFGNWGLKEHLNKSRSESPKFDAVMTFQEAVKTCWWDHCETSSPPGAAIIPPLLILTL